MKKLVIDRQKWYRGQGSQYSRLSRWDNTMCCLGFLCINEGFVREEILDKSFPSSLKSGDFANNIGLLKNQIYLNNAIKQLEFVIAEINDNKLIDDNTRESLLKEEFKKIDYEVEFIN